MYCIFGNYGNNTIALIEWARKKNLADVTVVNVDTGWGASAWQKVVNRGKQFATQCGFQITTLKPATTFEELVRDRRSFPSPKYQWCPTFLKALPLLAWLDEVDDKAEATILLGGRREDSRARQNLQEFIEQSEYYGDRKVWYPLFTLTVANRNQLITDAGFEVLNHRSLECDACIHSNISHLKLLEEKNKIRVAKLEQEIDANMFQANYGNFSIEELISQPSPKHEHAATSLEQFDMGCGSRYACGE